MKHFPIQAVCLWIALALLTGCGDKASNPGDKGGVEKVELRELDALGDVLPPLDDGRVQVAPPKGWAIAPRGSKYLARFMPTEDTDYPTILVLAEDCEAIADATPDNLKKLAAEVKQAEAVKHVKPITIGNEFHGVLYHKVNRERDSVNRVIDRLMVSTVAGGRRYTLELRTRSEGMQRDNQRYLYTVAHGLRFTKADDAATTEEPKAEPSKAADVKAAAENMAKPAATPEAKPKAKPAAKPEVKKEPEKPKRKSAKSDDLEGLNDLRK